MTQINITIDLEELKEKVENSSLESPVKASLSLILNSLMEKERDEYLSINWFFNFIFDHFSNSCKP